MANSRNETSAAWAVLAVLPILFVVSVLWMRAEAGPFYLWHVADPSYAYLFDGLNVAEGAAPGNVFHPGTPVQMLAALVLRAAHPASGGLAAAVLGAPETHLRLISDVLVVLVGAAMMVAGGVVYRLLVRLLPALIVQSAPFLSMLTMKYAYHVKPEPVLVAATLVLIALAAAATWSPDAARHRTRYAVGFGVLAGFTVAAKVTAAPIFVLPLLVLWQGRAIAIYIAASIVAAVVFTLPIAGHYGEMLAYFAHVGTTTGDYVQGAAGVIDFASYPDAVLKLFKRPVLLAPVLLLAAALIAAYWPRRGGPGNMRPVVPGALRRLAAGVALAMILQVLLVAKQPAAFYLIPSMVLGAFGIVVAAAMLAALQPWSHGSRVAGRWALGIVLAGLLVGQGAAYAKQVRELRTYRAEAAAFTDGRFARCAKVYFYSASVPAYALYLGDEVGGERHLAQLRGHVGANEFEFADFVTGRPDEVRGLDGHATLAEIVRAHPCTVFRGLAVRTSMAKYIGRTLPNLRFRDTCRAGREILMTAGTDCSGK